MYNFTNSRDGVARCTLKVDFRLSLEDIATILLAWDSDIYHEDYIEGTKTLCHKYLRKRFTSRQKVMRDVKAALYCDGYERPFYAVGDNNLLELRDQLITWLAEQWSYAP